MENSIIQSITIGEKFCKEIVDNICDKLFKKQISYIKIYKKSVGVYHLEYHEAKHDDKLSDNLIKKSYYALKEFYLMLTLNCTKHFYIEVDLVSCKYRIENDYTLNDCELNEIHLAIEYIEKALCIFEFLDLNALLNNTYVLHNGHYDKITIQDALNMVLRTID